jgi:hypothetical protein
LDIAHWALPKDHHVRLLSLGITENPHIVKLNVTLDELIATNTKAFFGEYKNSFTWNDIDSKGIPP